MISIARARVARISICGVANCTLTSKPLYLYKGIRKFANAPDPFQGPKTPLNPPPQNPQQQATEPHDQDQPGQQSPLNSQAAMDKFMETMHQNPHQIINGATIGNTNRLPFKTVIALVLGCVVTTMSVYVGVQIWSILDDDKPVEESKQRSVFIPLWFNVNWIYTSKYAYPKDLKYIDKDLHEYTVTEIEQNGGDAQYFYAFQDENVKYKVLEKTAKNQILRKIFHLPIPIEINQQNSGNFDIWVEMKYPSISGIQFNVKKEVSGRKIDVGWVIKPLNFGSIIEGALISAGLKLDRLERSEANSKIHEKASGRIHEVPISDHEDKRLLILNSKKDFDVYFKGEFMISEKKIDSGSKKPVNGILKYKGTIDFDHLMINRGVKIIELCIETVDEENDANGKSTGKGSTTTYKVI